MQSSHFRTQTHHGITWVDISDPSRERINQAMEGRTLHPLHLNASLLTGHLPHVEKEDDYVFLLLHLPDFNETKHKVQTKEVAIFLAKNYLITIHHGPISRLQELFDDCEHNGLIRDHYFKKSPGFLLSAILDNLLADASELIETILQKLDVIEDVVFDDRAAATYEIGLLRQRITKLKRLMDFLKNILTDFAPRVDDYTGEKLAHHYRHTARTAQRLAMSLEEAKETIEIFKDADYSASNQQTNAILAVLTIIFTLTIPATLVGTFYGMNIPLPGGIEVGAWTFWGPYTTLIIVMSLSVIPAVLMGWYFRKRKWL